MMPLLLLAAVVVVAPVWASSGRAFPVASENYVIELFQRINPKIEWDPTNFLVDLSGQYANCKHLGKTGHRHVHRETPEGATIGAIIDSTPGSGTDVVSVNSYIERVLDDWIRTGAYNGQAPLRLPQYALAFTHDQYDLAENITGNRWDRSHLLENLSGFETQCSMIRTTRGAWSFHKVRKMAAARGISIKGLFGSYPNPGSTELAMRTILEKFKKIKSAKRVGCSVIPDCPRGSIPEMYDVVVSCLYEK